ncbi:MAG TPA: CPBP family intramembrane glutamic endopeptidase [Fibrobacteria bacterium]|nr:CPBP family intramembrane glutamic endopeptidase [Fibrobacteria bacterium]
MDALISSLATLQGTLCAVAILSILLFLESFHSSWSPFFILHAILAIVIPVSMGFWPKETLFGTLSRNAGVAFAFFAALVLWEHFFSGLLYERWFLKRLGREKDPYYSPSLALESILERSARKLGLGLPASQALFAAYALIWAPFGEELLFWGWLHPSLGTAWGFWPATALVSLVFAAHHLLYLGGQWDRLPWGSLIAFSVSSFVTGILMSLLFRATHSLFPLMAVHVGANAVWVALSVLHPAPKPIAARKS